MSVLERAHAHLKTRRELASIEVPEWLDDEGKPTVIYFYPCMTLREQREILKHQDSPADAIAASVVVRSRNEDGSAMFAPAERGELMRKADANVLARIVTGMTALDVEEPSGN